MSLGEPNAEGAGVRVGELRAPTHPFSQPSTSIHRIDRSDAARSFAIWLFTLVDQEYYRVHAPLKNGWKKKGTICVTLVRGPFGTWRSRGGPDGLSTAPATASEEDPLLSKAKEEEGHEHQAII